MQKPRVDFINVTGRRFGRLVAVKLCRRPQDGLIGYRCRCDCGVEKFVGASNLRRATRSCGCAAKEAQLRTCYRHGHSNRPEYGIFMTIKQRCGNPQSPKWGSYGGSGIECRFRTFEEFFNELGARPSAKHSVDRIDGFWHYTVGNVRWATPSQQQQNRRPRIATLSIRDYAMMVAAPLSFGS